MIDRNRVPNRTTAALRTAAWRRATGLSLAAGGCAIVLLAAMVRGDILVATDQAVAQFDLIASASGGDTGGDPAQKDVFLRAPSGFDSFTPNDSTGTLSQSGPNGAATASAKGFVNASYSLTGDVLTVTGIASFDNAASFSRAQHPPDQTGGSVADGQFEFSFNFGLTSRLYQYSYTLKAGHDLVSAAPTANDSDGGVRFGGPTNLLNYSERINSGVNTTSLADSGILRPGGYFANMDLDMDTSAGGIELGQNHGSSLIDFELTVRPAFEWKNTAGGAFHTASNWTGNAVPGNADAAAFDLPGTYTVQLDSSASTKVLHASGNGVNVSFDTNGHSYTVDKVEVGGNPGDNVRLSFEDSGIVVTRPGRTAPAPISLTVASGMSVHGGGELDVALPTTSGTVDVDGGGLVVASGENSQWLAQSLLMGTSGKATLALSNKAILTTTTANVGLGGTGNATVTVSDADTTWTSDNLIVGGQGTGSVSVLNEAEVTARNITAGRDPASTGTIAVDGNSPNLSGFLFQNVPAGSLVIGDRGKGHLTVKNGGQVVAKGSVTIGASGGGSGDATVIGPTSTVRANALNVGILGNGTISVTNHGVLDVGGSATGRAVIGTNGTVNVAGGSFFANTLEVDGKLNIDANGAALVGSFSQNSDVGVLTVFPGGTLSGTGTITVPKVVAAGGTNAFTGGTVKPGHSPGTLTIQGDFEQQPGGVLEIEVTGTGANQFDVLNVTGAATLAGDLLLKFEDGFAPAKGDTFDFLAAGTMTGSFTNVQLHDLAPGFQFDLHPQAGGFSLIALNDAVSSRIPGDANDDGKVNFNDLLVLAQNFGKDGTYSTGDFDKDGSVDFSDLLILAQHFGQSSQAAATVVPEPSCVATGLAGSICLLRRRRRPLFS